MTTIPPPTRTRERLIDELVERRARSAAFIANQAPAIATLCRLMAERFGAHGRLIASGSSPQARSDARHVAVEFVHPVIVGKRALPAIAVTGEGGPVAAQLELLAEPNDIVLVFGDAADDRAALAVARRRGCLTATFQPSDADWVFDPPASDPFIRQELAETAYHLLWELVHVFLDHAAGDPSGASVNAANAFLYPFLGAASLDPVAATLDVQRSIEMKGAEIAELRRRTVTDARDTLLGAAAEVRAAFEGGGRVLALGNGGSATDAMDAVADLRMPPGSWTPRPALDLTEDAAILTALANDIGPDATFVRQVIAHGRPGDMLLAFSTSGGSRNVIAALAEGRRRGIRSIAFTGYGGGEIGDGGLADHLITVASEHIPRIQEAQSTAFHVLRELIELEAATA